MKQNRCVICGNIIPEGRQVCPNCNKGTTKINIGDTVKCLSCGQPIQLNGSTLIRYKTTEYIYCKNCKACYAMQEYNLKGEKYNVRI